MIAVKAFRLDLLPEHVARLADALRRLGKTPGLTHPGLVPAVDAGLEGTTAYLAMEYVAAETLDVALRHLAPAPIERALPILSQLAEIIDAAWAAGIGHGALHPRDVFVTVDSQEVRLTGVGVVPAIESIGVKAPVRRPYSAPERVNGDPWDVRADVYALGAIAHELLTRRRPAGAGEQDGALTTDTTPEQRVQIRRVLSAVLAEHPQHRFASARAFTDALAAIVRGDAMSLPEPEEVSDEDVLAPETKEESPLPLVVTSQPSTEQPAASSEPVVLSTEHEAASMEHRVPSTEPQARSTEHPALSTEHPARGSDLWAPISEPSVSSVEPPVEPVETSFPWSAVLAVAAAGLAVGTLIGYQWGVHTVASPPAPIVAKAAPETEVALPPEPVPTQPSAALTKEAAEASPRAQPAEEPPSRPRATGRSAESPVARAAVQRGRLVIRSIPPGALVLLDGRARGQTPATLGELPFGEHTLEVARSGFVPHRERVTLTASAPVRTFSVTLQPGLPTSSTADAAATAASAASGSVFVDSRPQAARVIIDGRYMGMTPLRVPGVRSGSHAVRLERSGYQSFSTVIGVRAGEQARVTAALEEQRNN